MCYFILGGANEGWQSKRLTQLSETMIQIDFLYTELGITPPSLDDLPASASSSSSLAVPTLHRTASSSSITTDPFLSSSFSTPTPNFNNHSNNFTKSLFLTSTPPSPSSSTALESTYQTIFATFIAHLEEADSESLHSAESALANVSPTPGLLSWANDLVTALTALKTQREARIQALYDQLEGLWRRLGVEEADMDAFVENHRGSTEGVVWEYEAELERMMELKREKMGVFVGSARGEIERLWNDMMFGEEERQDFVPFFDGMSLRLLILFFSDLIYYPSPDEHTEELLTLHEAEIKRLKEERRLKAPLLAGIKKYFDICEEEKELAASACDQGRLLGRGVRGDPGRLLREEKMRRRVGKEKPRVVLFLCFLFFQFIYL